MSPRSIVGRDTAGSANSTTRNFNDTRQPVHDTARRVTPTDELIKDLTPEQAEVLLKRASLSNCEWSERSLAAVAIDEFLKRHKAYLNNDHNKAEIVFYLQQHNLPTTLASLESAYYSLVRAGLLSIDQPEFNKEEGARR